MYPTFVDFVRATKRELRLLKARIRGAENITKLRKAYESAPFLVSTEQQMGKYNYSMDFTLIVEDVDGTFVADYEYDNTELPLIKAYLLGMAEMYEYFITRLNNSQEV